MCMLYRNNHKQTKFDGLINRGGRILPQRINKPLLSVHTHIIMIKLFQYLALCYLVSKTTVGAC